MTMPSDPQVERLAILLATANIELVVGVGLWPSSRRKLAAWLIEHGVTLAPAGEPTFPQCEVCGSSAWVCSVCPQAPSGCCAACFVRERIVTALTALMEIADESTLDIYLRAKLANLRAILGRPCTHAAEPHCNHCGSSATYLYQRQ